MFPIKELRGAESSVEKQYILIPKGMQTILIARLRRKGTSRKDRGEID